MRTPTSGLRRACASPFPRFQQHGRLKPVQGCCSIWCGVRGNRLLTRPGARGAEARGVPMTSRGETKCRYRAESLERGWDGCAACVTNRSVSSRGALGRQHVTVSREATWRSYSRTGISAGDWDGFAAVAVRYAWAFQSFPLQGLDVGNHCGVRMGVSPGPQPPSPGEGPSR